MKLRSWMARLREIDRRWLYLLLAATIVAPLVAPVRWPSTPSRDVRAAYDTLRALPPGSALLVAADYDSGAMPEVQPFIEALLELAFARDLRVVSMSLWPQAPELIDRAFREVAPRHGKRYGQHYANLGFKEGKIVVMTKIGESLAGTFPVDNAGTRVGELAVMRGLERLGDFSALVLVGAGYPGPAEWIPQVQGRFIDTVVAATVSLTAPDLVPFVQSRQLAGLVAGMAGAAQLEQLVGRPADGSAGMDAQSLAHLLIIGAIVVANASYLARRRRSP